jgi:hypothetical protein
MKIIKVESCKECPYRKFTLCTYDGHHNEGTKSIVDYLDSIHPDCKLENYKKGE